MGESGSAHDPLIAAETMGPFSDEMTRPASVDPNPSTSSAARAAREPRSLTVPVRVAEPMLDVAALSIRVLGWAEARKSQQRLRRRLLAGADAAAMTAALLAVVGRFGMRPGALIGLMVEPIVLAAFKLAGLYRRDERRLSQVALDEAPIVLGFAGLFALGGFLFASIFSVERLTAAQVTALWLVTFGAILALRALARVMTRRLTPAESCPIIEHSAPAAGRRRVTRQGLRTRLRELRQVVRLNP